MLAPMTMAVRAPSVVVVVVKGLIDGLSCKGRARRQRTFHQIGIAAHEPTPRRGRRALSPARVVFRSLHRVRHSGAHPCVENLPMNCPNLSPHRSHPPALLATALLAACGPALADDSWRLRLGPAHIGFAEDVRLSALGMDLPGAGARLSSNTTLLTELAYSLAPNLSVGLTFGVPPTTTVNATGVAEPAGTLGRVKYGPLALALQVQLDAGARWQPYAGAGIVRFVTFGTSDVALTQLKVDDAWGGLLQAGVEFPLAPHWSLFADLRKVFLKTRARGNLELAGGAPLQARARLDPTVLQAGLSLRF
jgi:outer membrane protein